MELGIQREERLATHSSSGPLRRQLGHMGPLSAGILLHRPAGERGGQKHSMCFSSTVMSSFDQKKSADDSTTRLFF